MLYFLIYVAICLGLAMIWSEWVYICIYSMQIEVVFVAKSFAGYFNRDYLFLFAFLFQF